MGKNKKKAKRIAEAEHELVGSVAAAAEHKPVALLGAASEIADQPPLVALSVATIAAGLILRRRDITRTGARMLLAHALATGGKTILKRSIDRSRPARALLDGEAKVGAGKGADDTEFNSFPSGHTAGAVSVAEAVARTAPRLAWPARSGAAAVAAVQLPRGAHYPTDVAIGAVIGWTAERLADAIIDAAERGFNRVREQRLESTALALAEAHPS
ncbi:phosphatase PAP2 family protein [Sphingomonas sp. IC4-52]|uniref:phosphatase PAP2 family protein n=1 Tax=Sphingomonas sp. IC4-52 TaxID=2887202 RepID=UPI001D11C058|nr:phosphatase PAP2 family protein [Sphingomonas sp. IC4-52]MCC2978513.1 phosphatase PAP2 family protein [Sphingomonas sp. IC4-52]